MWKMRSLWTLYRSQNVWWVGAARSEWRILSEQVHSLKTERHQERLYLKEGSSLQPLRQGRIVTAKIQQTG